MEISEFPVKILQEKKFQTKNISLSAYNDSGRKKRCCLMKD